MKILLLLLALCCSLDSPAAIYRWVDANGQTVYSQTPPPDGPADTLKAPREPTPDAAAERARLEQRTRRVDDYIEDRQLKAQARREAQAARALKEKNCQVARSNYQTLQNAGRRLVKGPDGEYRRLPESERLKRMEEARQHIDNYCN